MAEEKPNYYVVHIDLAFLGIHVEAHSEQEAKEKAMAVFDTPPAGTVGIEVGIIRARVEKVEDDDETSDSTIGELLS